MDEQDRTLWITRRDLFERIWSKPMTTNADELGVAAPALAALATRLGLPLPRAGHWMKQSVGRQPPTPDYPADPRLDEASHLLPAPPARRSPRPKAVEPEAKRAVDAAEPAPNETAGAPPDAVVTAASDPAIDPHRKVASTRSAIQRSGTTNRASIGGRGKFRLLVAPASGERACAVLDRLVLAAEANDWPLESTDQGYAITADGETIGFMIEEKLDRVPHVVTAAELREKADYDRKCALADRGIGYRPWRAPAIPEHDHVPNGELVLKFDHSYETGGTRRTFSDGKRQRLEDLVPLMIDALERAAAAAKARREERAQRERHWAEQERLRKDHERQVRVEGYRITFLQRQIERRREIDGLSSLLAEWEAGKDVDPKFAELVDFARLYRTWLEAKIAPAAVAERIGALKLMDEDVYIYDAKRLD